MVQGCSRASARPERAGVALVPTDLHSLPEILKQVKAIELRTRGLVGSLFAGEYRSVFRGQGMEFAEVRAYEPGDDFRTIDWNVSARLGESLRQDLTPRSASSP